MLKFLLAVDGSHASNKAVGRFIQLLDWYKETPEIHLLNVQFPQRGNVPLFIDKKSIDHYHREEGMRDLHAARKLLGQANITCHIHITVGDPAEMILRYAQETSCDQIIIGPRGLGLVKGLFLGSVASKVMQFSTLPVLLVK
ncbi:universal stress protein [Nitrosovibrio tenuis]|uniref:Nucleotide-binding universal stress protein, UspA family n=1 Tax=Nitrosovibrio tenuis TaxID=1233 RepID=A0A1H7G2P7_9PROT|nr:universal stress protein [Nitrosovibrio tenuis]SEK32459.1 Nucleotide-binding universal stress protein, UspA family [Nitrosovibrio tenuis]